MHVFFYIYFQKHMVPSQHIKHVSHESSFQLITLREYIILFHALSLHILKH